MGRPRGEWIAVECAHCGTTVERRAARVTENTSGRFFCSQECRNILGSKPRRKPQSPPKAERVKKPRPPVSGRPKVERVQVACAGCGQLQERRATDMARLTTGRVFCSKECRDRIGCKPRRKEDSTCEQCGVTFYPNSGGPNRFCSKDCHDNWMRRNRTESTCEVCGKLFAMKPSQAKSWTGRWCSPHCQGIGRTKRHSGRWHNGKPVIQTEQGYLKLWEPDYPNSKKGRILEHRFVAEQILGRSLRRDEHVHHVNGDKTDNRPENLEVMSASDHSQRTNLESEAKRQAIMAELEAYRKRFGPLTEE